MALYNLYNHDVVIQYKSNLLSKATLFTIITSLLNIILPLVIAYRSRGFWLKSYYYYEQAQVRPTYEYLLVAETDEPNINIICGQAAALGTEMDDGENCVEIQIQEHGHEDSVKNDIIEYNFKLYIPERRIITSLILLLGVDYQFVDICPLQMQALAVINKEFPTTPSGFKYYGDIHLYQTSHLPCLRNVLDIRYNRSLFNYTSDNNLNVIDLIMEENLKREVSTHITTIYSRVQNGNTGTIDVNIMLRIPETQIKYKPSVIQELKWAWPQYLSLYIIFYWMFKKLRRFIFINRLLMAWEIVPWKRKEKFI
ncbi:transmembrane protein 231 [Danaus plexippus]|uniref:transmembrane protein 231 n=1 Tax=Danaus plexippus TaxID=13037 RepID=UPI002AB0BB3A|nr:transmembrane protein 231 [Danaus plexippus]